MDTNYKNKKATRLDREYAYKFLLNRLPENTKVVKPHGETFGEMMDEFCDSIEFKNRLEKIANDLLLSRENNLEIEYDVAEENFEKILSHIETVWNEYGKNESYWSVLIHDKFKSTNIEKNIEEFYDTGRGTLNWIESILRYCGEWESLIGGGGGVCMEYGCGVGRVTMQLASVFDRVIGMDISKEHLKIARERSESLGIKNIDFKKIQTISDIDKIGECDFIFSLIVLQHNPPPIIAAIIKKIFYRIKHNGIAMFQVPVNIDGYSFSTKEYLAKIDNINEMEMHALPQKVILELGRNYSCCPLEIFDDNSTGNIFMKSQTFVFKKIGK
jgi:2-polyprenyl-3-methyl-5-hydroxy-6-metoxy-1,4-benzoquinol methylase